MTDDTNKTNDDAKGEVPEVEAEVVSEQASIDDGAQVNDGFSDEEEAVVPPKPAKPSRSPLALLIIAGLALGVGAVGFWRFQVRDVPLTAELEDANNATLQNDSPLNTEPLASSSEGDQSKDDIDPDIIEELDQAPFPEAGTASKITNELSEDLKALDMPVLSEIPIDGLDLEGGSVLFVTGDTDKIEGNIDFEASAKAALDQAEELEPSAPDGLSDDATDMMAEEAVEGISGFELEASSDTAPDAPGLTEFDEAATSKISNVETPLDQGLEDVESLPDEAASLMASVLESEKIENQIEAVKESFRGEIAGLEASLAEERERNEAQRQEIETLRQEFAVALAERDQQAVDREEALNAQLAQVTAQQSVVAEGQANALLAVAALRAEIAKGHPYESQLRGLLEVMPEADDEVKLQQWAASGVPSLATLKESFRPAVRDALTGAAQEATSGAWGKLMAKAQSLVSLRPAQAMAGNSVMAIISRAENQLENGNIRTAIMEIETLPVVPRTAFSDWLVLAKSRADIDDIIAVLSNNVAAPSQQDE